MTSEVVVMNRLAVALAADSATTVSGPNSQKIWNSANKLFALSKTHPVGVMFYNNASILGVPWETIIKAYRAELGCRAFDSLEQYGDDFLRFLNEARLMFPDELQRKYFMRAFSATLKRLVEHAHQAFIDALVEGRPGNEADEFLKVVDGELAEWEQLDDLNTTPAHAEAGLLGAYGQEVDGAIESALEHLTEIAELEEVKSKLRRLAVLSVTKAEFGDEYTGVVFAGFGEKQHFPVVQSLRIGGVILDYVRHSVPDIEAISDTNPSSVKPFAQSEMVTTFLEGINPRLRRNFIRNFVTLTLGLPETVIDAISDLDDARKQHWKAQVRDQAGAAITSMLEKLKRHRFENHYAPIHAALVHLPKDELANVAESLVNLNSFQKKVSMDDETVGGPIDVAVISKGDGLIWIKRKHYFSRELNEHYFNNMQRHQEI